MTSEEQQTMLEIDQKIAKLIGRDQNLAVPFYSLDIADALTVLAYFHKENWSWCIEQADDADFPTVHIIRPDFAKKYTDHINFVEDMEKVSASAKTLAHAICLAAIKIIESKEV
jgi:hypothetical protein